VADVAVVLVYPDLLGTYGDGGNARILAQRLRWRGIGASVVEVRLGDPVPRAGQLYVLGGGEDRPQALAAAELRASGALGAAVEGGAAVLAVCAGLQVVGTRFLTADGLCEGVGLVDVETVRGLPARAVGELAVDPDPQLGLPRMSGYENHAGATRLGPGVDAFGAVVSGVGNGGDGARGGGDGFVAGRVLGTYLHGPVLARNPELADLLLGWVVGDLPPLERPEVDAEARGLRAERLASLGRRHGSFSRHARAHHLGT
jgi:lipid II isoglutaminyl synthase (glutamine-hydrolysing)